MEVVKRSNHLGEKARRIQKKTNSQASHSVLRTIWPRAGNLINSVDWHPPTSSRPDEAPNPPEADTFPDESAECKNFAEMVRPIICKSCRNRRLQLLACRWKADFLTSYRCEEGSKCLQLEFGPVLVRPGVARMWRGSKRGLFPWYRRTSLRFPKLTERTSVKL